MTDIFSGQPSTPPAGTDPQAPAPNQIDTMLDGIKNESGQRKYATLEAALQALQHTQNEYIPTLKTQLSEKEQRLAELEEVAARSKKLEDLVTALTAPPPPAGSGDPPQPSGLSEQAVVDLVKQTLGQSEQQRAAETNARLVADSLVAKYGDKAVEVVNQKAAELGIQPTEIRELAKKSPALVLQLFNTQAKTTPTPTTSSVVVPPINPSKPEIKRPDKSVLVGATMKEQTAHLAQIRDAIYAKHGITS